MLSSSGARIKDANQRGDLSLSTATLNTSDRLSADTEVVLTKKSKRIPALDLTKGILVLIMVLYHWINYFVMADGSVYKYLRFLTPSFIFVTGFLISQVYLSKYQTSGLQVPWRLLVRGGKLLGIVLCLNVALSAMHLNGLKARVGDWSPGEIAAAFLTGTAPVAFSVLVPIAYLLILSAGLLVASRRYRNIYHVACGVFVGCALLLEWKGIKGGYLQIFSIGMLGISIGYTPIDRINRLVKHSLIISSAYLAYLSAITLYDDVYALQVVGVCLSLAIIYLIGIRYAETNRLGKIAVLLGQYSLFAYIAQIVILQILRRAVHAPGEGMGVSVAALAAALACTILSVAFLDRARGRVAGLNKAYTAVFG
jgi:peptidoglycan/LPS O-acetylase OafA/YrhL